MTTGIPAEFGRLMPMLNCKNADKAIEFYKQVLGAEAPFILRDKNGKVLNSMIMVGKASFMLSDLMQQSPMKLKTAVEDTQVGLYLYMEDVDDCLKKAKQAGSSAIEPAQDMFWGDRMGSFVDLDHNQWTIATQTKNIPPEELQKIANSFGD